MERTIDGLGGLDIVVASAARVDHGPIDRADPVGWADAITTNVLGVLYVVRASLAHLYGAMDGAMWLIRGVRFGSGHVRGRAPAYVTSKHAVVAFADCLRKETAGRGVRVSVLEPGLVDTAFIDWDAIRPHVPAEVIPLAADDCARIIRFMLEQPPNVGVTELVVRPTGQVL